MNPEQLQGRWPETANYLERIGQINNDLMLLRDIAARESMIPTWLDELAISPEDLIKEPNGFRTARFLHLWGYPIQEAAMTVPDFKEVQEEQNEERGDDLDSILDNLVIQTVGPEGDAQLFALPVVESYLNQWATKRLATYRQIPEQPLTFPQTIMLMHLHQYLLQEDAGDEWIEASQRSLLSSDFFTQAAHPAQKS